MKINVPNIRQIQYEICWAACIEMVARYVCKPGSPDLHTRTLVGSAVPVPLQYEILEEYLLIDTTLDTDSDHAAINSQESLLLKNFCIPQGGFPGMTYGNNKYQRIFKSRFGINCIQMEETHFPSYNFLSKVIDKKQPVILGIKYPGFAKNHAVVITGYSKVNHQRMLRVNDPLTDNGNGLICQERQGKEKYLCYDLLNQLNRPEQVVTAHTLQLMNIVYNFWEETETAATPYQSEIKSPALYESTDEIIQIVKELFYLNALFEVQFDALKFNSNIIQYGSISLENFVQNHTNPFLNLLIPIIVDEEQRYEIVVFEGASNISGYYFAGVQESYFPKLISIQEVTVKDFDGIVMQISVNHIAPNYFILQILPINLFLMVFQGEHFKSYVSLSDIPYSGIKYFYSYSFEDLTEILKFCYPACFQ